MVEPKQRFMFHFSKEISDLLRKIPKGEMTDTVEKALSVYFNGDMARIEFQYREAGRNKDRSDAEFLIWKDRYESGKREEKDKILYLLKEIGFSKTRLPDIRPSEYDDVYPFLLRHGFKRTKREVLDILEGME